MKRILLFLFCTFGIYCAFAQQVPDYIKSIQLKPLQKTNFAIVVPVGTTLELNFDDLEGDQKDYYYKIEQMNHDWTLSRLLPSQYINGFQSRMIFDDKFV